MDTKYEDVSDEVILLPEDYELPSHLAEWERKQVQRLKQPVRVTRKQMEHYGSLGVPWIDIEKLFCVSRVTLMRHFKRDYDRGYANTNNKLRDKMLELALAGNIPALIFTAKNRLNMSDNGPQKDNETDENLRPELNVSLKVLSPENFK